MSAARRTALLSLAAALLLGAAKLVVGLASGSLGIVAEAAHSGVDAVAALLTFYAVSLAERPADVEHQYGHGKAQHLSALAESLILAAAAGWVALVAVQRLSDGTSGFDPPWYAFALVGGVLAVDAFRARVSFREGQRSRSAALMANAWHFTSDFVGTLAVFAGLVLARAGYPEGDAWAAIFVAAIVLVAAFRLAARNVDSLMDRAPAGLAARIERAVAEVPGVREVRSVRVREAGGENFADVVIGISRLSGLERSHETMDAVEQAVEEHVGRTRVTVHVEPMASGERANERVAAAALRVPGVEEVHNITVLEERSSRVITLHARVGAELPLPEAESIVRQLKREIARELEADEVYVHVEPFAPDPQDVRDVSRDEPSVYGAALAAVRAVAGADATVKLYRQGPRVLVVTALQGDPTLSVREAHALASRVEDAVRAAVPHVDDVIVEVSEPSATLTP